MPVDCSSVEGVKPLLLKYQELVSLHDRFHCQKEKKAPPHTKIKRGQKRPLQMWTRAHE